MFELRAPEGCCLARTLATAVLDHSLEESNLLVDAADAAVRPPLQAVAAANFLEDGWADVCQRLQSTEGPKAQVLQRHTQDLRCFVDRPVEEGSNTRNISAALGVAAGMDRHAIRLHAQGQQR